MSGRGPRAHRFYDAGILPLVNVVFLLLIFVMVAGRMAALEEARVDPPASAHGEAVAPGALAITVAADGAIHVDGEPVDVRALADRIAGTGASGADPPRVRLRADARADSRHIVTVVTALRDAGVTRVELLTVPRR